MFSWYFWQSVEKGRQYQSLGKGWAGNDVKKYKNYIRDLVKLYNAETMLDYGSGRGEQYSTAVPYPTESFGTYTAPMTFDQYIGVTKVTQYDPCVTGIHVLPEISSRFDAVICTQVLGSIPDDDLPTVLGLLGTYATKFCFVSLIDPDVQQAKSNKTNIYDPEYFRANRSKSWYFDLFKQHWKGVCCYLLFRSGQIYDSKWMKKEISHGTLLKLG